MMVKNTNEFSTSFQNENLTINSIVADVPWSIGKNGEEIMHALYASAKFMQRKPKPYLSSLASPQSDMPLFT